MSDQHHLQLEIQRLERDLDQMTRRYERTADIARAAEHLYRVILEKSRTTTSGGVFGSAVENLAQAIRNAHDMDGGGR